MVVDWFSLTSAEAVSRQLTNFITVSGVPTYKAEITYVPSEFVTYEISAGARFTRVYPNYQVSYVTKKAAFQTYSVPLDDFQFSAVNYFTIKKSIIGGESRYSISATKK